MADDEEMADEKDMADEDSTNPYIEQNGTLSTPMIEIKSEVLEVEMTQKSIENVSPDPQVMGDSLMPQETDDKGNINEKEREKKKEKDKSKCRGSSHIPAVLRSPCRPRSRDPRRCQKLFREMIGKHQIKNEELEKKEGDLRQRLEMLECSMPAVMVWNIWRKSQGAPVPRLRRVVEKQFQGFASGGLPCPSTPSQHYDCRVRQVEAERKQAQRRADEARALWAEKEFALEEQKRKLEEARKTQALHKERIEKLTNEVEELRKARENERAALSEESCQSGECGELRCKQMWLGDVASTTSVKSTDLECLARLQELAEAELCMKRHITELERREETYMRTLQQADVLWSKMEGDTASEMNNLQEQLDLKMAANQQLAFKVCCLEDAIEKLNSKLANCRNELGKVVGVDRVDAIIGSDDDHATVANKDCLAKMKVGTVDEETMAENAGALSDAKETPDQDSSSNSDEDGVICGPDEMCTKFDEDGVTCGSNEICAKFNEDGVICGPDKICAGFDKDEDSDSEGKPCGPDFVCNDVVFSPTGMEDADTVIEVASLAIQETEIEQEEENKGKLETDVGRESDEEYQMAVEYLSETKRPPQKWEESEKMHEVGKPSVIGKLSSEEIVQDSKAVERRYKKEIAEIDAVEGDQVEHEKEKLSGVSQDFSVEDNVVTKTYKDIGESILSEEKETMPDEEKLSQDLHLQKISEKVEKDKEKQFEEIMEGKEKMQKIRDEQVTKVEEREGIVHIIPKEEEEGTKLEVISEKDQLSYKAPIPEKERLVERKGEERLTVTSEEDKLETIKKTKEISDNKEGRKVKERMEGKEITNIIPEEEKILSVKSVKNQEEQITDERLELKTKPILTISEDSAKNLPAEELKEEIKLPIAKGEEILPAKKLKAEEKVSIIEGAEILSVKELKEKEKVSIAEGAEFLPAEELKEEKVSIAEGAEFLPAEEMEKEEGITEGAEILPPKKLKEEERVSIAQGAEILPAERLEKEEGITEEAKEDVGEKEIEKEIMPAIPEVKDICESTPEDLVPVLGEIPEEGKEESEEDFSCICQTEIVPREEPKVEKELPKPVSEDDVKIMEKSTCICKEKDVSRDGKSRRKLLIIRKTISRRPDESKVYLERDESSIKGRKTKMTYIKVKDESIGTVVSVGLQTQEKFQNNEKSEEAQSVGTDSTISCLCTGRSTKKEKVQEKFKGPTDSESRCFMCKKELCSREDVFEINDSKSASSPKTTDSKTEINMVCFTCQRKQASKSKIQSKSKCPNCEEPRKPRPLSSVTVGESTISSHISSQISSKKKMTAISQEKRDQGCLAKISRSKVNHKERKKKPESEPNVQNRKRLLEKQSKHESDGSVFSRTDTCQIVTQQSSSCTCIIDKTSSLNGKKSNNEGKQVKGEENRSCHCSDSN